jgi:hypothetical protein
VKLFRSARSHKAPWKPNAAASLALVQLGRRYDPLLAEQCYEYGECGVYSAAGSFLPAGKAVFDVEYSMAPSYSQADQAHMNAQQSDLDLVGATDSGYEYAPCVPDSHATW